MADAAYGRDNDPAATRRQAEQLRRELRDCVTAWMKHGATPDPRELARLVAAAPANQTLSEYEWWNVALLVSQEMTYRG